MKLYKSYMFKDKDPAIDELRTVIQQTHSGRLSGKTLTMVEHDDGPTAGCMRGWFFGKTKRPLSATLEAAGRAVGYRRVWVKHKRKPNGMAG